MQSVELHRFPRLIRVVFLISSAVLLVLTSSTSHVLAANCASSLSQLDCQALTNGWTDWVPLSPSCSGSGSGGALTGADNVLKIMNYFTSKGYTPEQAAGIAGNTTVESGNEPLRLQIGAMPNVTTISYVKIPTNVLTAQVGWGIVQWTPPQKIGIYAQSTSKNPDDLATQVEFLWKQLEGTAPNSSEKPAGDALKKTTSAADAATAFMNFYERPSQDPNVNHLPQRVSDAQDALKVFKNAGGAPTSPGSADTSTGCSTGTIAGSCTTPAPSGGYGPVKQALMSQFKINLVGDANAGWAVETYNTVCALSKAPAYYTKLVAQGPITVTLVGGGCGSGFASSDTGVHLYGMCDKDYNRFIITHELGHMFSFRNQQLFQDFQAQVFTKNPLLPTWDCMIHSFGPNGPVSSGPYMGSQKDECWADMIGEYLMYFNLRETVGGAPPGKSADFKEYPTQYSAYYSFAKDKLFGGVEYKSF